MKALHIIPGLDPADGGPSTAMVGLAEAQHRAGLGVCVTTCAPPGTDLRLIERLRAAGVEVVTLDDPGGLFSCPPAMRQALQAQTAKADIVHIHALWEPLQHFAAVEARRQNKPYLIRPCGMLTDWSMAQKKLKKRLFYHGRLARNLRGAAAIHFTAGREQELSQSRAQGRPGVIAPNGVDASAFASLPPKDAFRGRHTNLTDQRIVLFVGRLHPVKGLDLLIPAFARAQLENTCLVLVGSGSPAYVDQLKQLAVAKGIAERVVFTGMLHADEKLAAYVDADLFVLPSHHENFGIVVVESLACGTPVLLSDQVAICREIESAGVGHVVTIQDETAFRDGLSSAADQFFANDSLRQQCRPFVHSRFNWDTIAKGWRQTYLELLSQASAAR